MIFLSFSDFPRGSWVRCVFVLPLRGKTAPKKRGKCDFFSLYQKAVRPGFLRCGGRERQLPPALWKTQRRNAVRLAKYVIARSEATWQSVPLNVRWKLRWMLRRHSRRDRRLKTCHRHVFLTPRRRTPHSACKICHCEGRSDVAIRSLFRYTDSHASMSTGSE